MEEEGGNPRTLRDTVVIKNKLLEEVRVFLTQPVVRQKLDSFFSDGDYYRELIRRITVELTH